MSIRGILFVIGVWTFVLLLAFKPFWIWTAFVLLLAGSATVAAYLVGARKL
jgi:hypothetical protein